jgi:DNA invertase Pin-like site-specific DNA recombinase
MIGVYMRVSTTRQDTKSQEPDLKAWTTGKEGVAYYSDKATGKNMDRPGFQALLADVRARRIKTVVCWRLDRLGRSCSGLTALFDEFTALGVNFISLKDGIDLSTPAGRMLANVLASVAQFETECRAERIQAGLAAKRERVAAGEETWNAGRPAGTPNKATPEVAEAVREQVGKGRSKSAVAKMFNLSRPTVYAILKGVAA